MSTTAIEKNNLDESDSVSEKWVRPRMIDMPKGRLAMWWLIASEIVIFGGLIATYILFRLRHPEWGHAAGHTSTPLGALNTFFLLTSSLTIVLAHDAANRKDIKGAVRNMGITLFFGLGFLVVKSIEYATEISHGFTLTAELFWSFYFLMTGLHALHVIAGMTTIFIIMLGVRKGQHLHRVEFAGMYWHLVDLVWILLFPLLYIAH